MGKQKNPSGKIEYVDNIKEFYTLATENFVINSVAYIAPCNVATTANLTSNYINGSSGAGATLTNAGTQAVLNIDSLALAIGSRVLVKNQTTNTQNGVYVVTDAGSASTNWVLTRVTELDNYTQFVRGMIVNVFAGTLNTSKIFMLTSAVTVNIGSAAVVFSDLSSSGITGIQGTTNQINVSIASGVATLSIADNVRFGGTSGVGMVVGNNANKPSFANCYAGLTRLNTDL
jgi:hypothetical protein